MQKQRARYANWLGETNDITRMFLAANQIPDMINMAGGLPESAVYPTEELSRIAQQAITLHPAETLDYGPIEGLPGLRDLIASRFSDDRLSLTRENVLITSGGMQGLDLIGKALLDSGDVIACQSPAYLGALDAWRPRQPQYKLFFPEAPKFNASKSLRGAKFAYTVPNFSNPTGRLIDTATRQSLVASAKQTGTWLLEDDPYGTLYYDAPPLPRILSLSATNTSCAYDGPVIYLGTVSKELTPGLRTGWVIADKEMISTLTVVKQGTDMCTSGVSQRIVLDALSRKLDQEILPVILETYRSRRDHLCHAMENLLSEWFHWEKPVGGMFVWAVAKDSGVDTDRLLKHAMEHKVCITPSSVFDPAGEFKQAIRINFTRNPPDRLVEGVRRISEACKAMSKDTD